MEFKGRIIKVLPVVEGKSQKGEWKKISFVVEEQNTQFPKKALFEVFGEDKFKAMPLVVGEDVLVSFDVDAHEFNGRWYNTLRAWRVAGGGLLQQLPEAQPVQPTQPAPPPVESGLPF
jgi:hypothetical protein